MHLKLITIGNRPPTWAESGASEYEKRFRVPYTFQHIHLRAVKRPKGASINASTTKEAECILAQIKESDIIVALDEQGESWSTENLSFHLESWFEQNLKVAFIIGGPDGLAPQILSKAKHLWSLSKLTLPHHIARIMVTEALYRAMTSNVGHPYHRD